ncbi:MAG: hypothetical protein J6Z79_03500 [Clostridia bacterium]|nr:hypothetical protein [Clostridia bacterium]
MCGKGRCCAVAALAFGAGVLAALFLPRGFLVGVEALLILAAGILLLSGK